LDYIEKVLKSDVGGFKIGGLRSMYNPPYHKKSTNHEHSCFEKQYENALLDDGGNVCTANSASDADRVAAYKKSSAGGWGWSDPARAASKKPCHYKKTVDKISVYTGKDDIGKLGMMSTIKGKNVVEGRMDFTPEGSKFYNPDLPTWGKEVKVEGYTGAVFGPLWHRLDDGTTGIDIQFDKEKYDKAMEDKSLFPGEYTMWFGPAQRQMTIKKRKRRPGYAWPRHDIASLPIGKMG